MGFATKTTWDETCTFPLTSKNAIGEITRTRYYGVDDKLPTPIETRRSGALATFNLSGRYGQVAAVIDANAAISVRSYDEWGRSVLVWNPLDRVDRPGLRPEYHDAVCERYDHTERIGDIETGSAIEIFSNASCDLFGDVSLRLKEPARVTTLMWDDQLRRCLDSKGQVVPCYNSSAVQFAAETATGAYRVSHTFGDAQIQSQSVNNDKPTWTVSGIGDFDVLGRTNRQFKIGLLPSACPPAGTWCGGKGLSGDPLRKNVARIQTAYDARSRVIRTYGPGWPTCEGDPSEAKLVNSLPTLELKCDTPNQPPLVNDVTKFEYPAPGDTITTDGNNVPTLVRSDARGLMTLFQEYVLAPAITTATPYSMVSSTYRPVGSTC